MDGHNDNLTHMQCTPCRMGGKTIPIDPLSAYTSQLADGWQVVDDHHLEKTFTFKNFKQALAFTNPIGDLAEAQGHHPDIGLSWGKLGRIKSTTFMKMTSFWRSKSINSQYKR